MVNVAVTPVFIFLVIQRYVYQVFLNVIMIIDINHSEVEFNKNISSRILISF